MYYNIKESGERIRQLRLKSGYTQEKIADALNIDRSLLSHVEAGKRGCSVDLLIQFSDFFKVSLDYLILWVKQTDLQKVDNHIQLRETAESLISLMGTFKELLEIECDK